MTEELLNLAIWHELGRAISKNRDEAEAQRMALLFDGYDLGETRNRDCRFGLGVRGAALLRPYKFCVARYRVAGKLWAASWAVG